jgi:hypothetical protein
MVGMIISDYNKTLAKKEIYELRPRLYPHLLVALVLDEKEERVLGVIYLEAKVVRRFQISDVEDVFRRIKEVSPLLAKVVKEWEPRPDLDFDNQNLSDLIVEHGMDMFRANFRNAILDGANFDGVKLEEAVFDGAQCRDAQFTGAEMTKAQMIGTNFAGATLAEANLSYCHAIIGANFSGADLRRANFSRAIVERSNFSGADMGGADLTQAKFRHVDLSESSFRGACLVNATFESCQWIHADLTNCTIDRSAHKNLPENIAKEYEETFRFID